MKESDGTSPLESSHDDYEASLSPPDDGLTLAERLDLAFDQEFACGGPQSLEVEGGIDAEEVAYLKRVEQAFETDSEGRIVSVGLYCDGESGLDMNEVISHLARLRHVRFFGCHQPNWDAPGRLRPESLVHLAKWSELEVIMSETFVPTGDGFAALAELNPLLKLREVCVRPYGRSHGNKMLQALRKSTALKTLSIDYCNLDDQGLGHLENIAHLEHLSLDNTLVTGVGLRHLTKLTGLRHLSLSECPITDDGLREIFEFRKLETLYIAAQKVSENGLSGIGKLVSLRSLAVHGATITPATIDRLRRLKLLNDLSVAGCHFNDNSVSLLSGLKRLKYLDLRRTEITSDEIKRLRRLLPDCKVYDAD